MPSLTGFHPKWRVLRVSTRLHIKLTIQDTTQLSNYFLGDKHTRIPLLPPWEYHSFVTRAEVPG